MAKISRIIALCAILTAALFAASSASAASVNTRMVSVSTIVEFGNAIQPVTINQSSQINIARVIQIGGTGTADATIVQNGTNNYANVFQGANTNNALIEQTGITNTAYITQVSGSNNTLAGQLGSLNIGIVLQFGVRHLGGIIQSMR